MRNKKHTKIAAIITGVLILLAVCTACNMGTSDDGDNSNSNTDGAILTDTDYIMQTETNNNDDGVINIEIDNATDELLSQYESFHEYNHVDEAARIIIRTDRAINNFEYIKIGHDAIADEVVFFMEYAEHTVDELTPEKPFMVKTYGHWGTMPHYGVSFVDANDIRRFFYIFESGYDGSLLLVEFQNYFSLEDTAKASVYPFETSYFEKITDTYGKTPDLLSAIGMPPTKLTISGSHTGFMITTNPFDTEAAKLRAVGALTEAGYVQVTDVTGNWAFSSEFQDFGSVYYRDHDKTFISVSIEEDNIVIRYAHNHYNSYEGNSGDGSGYSGLLFDSSYYDVAIDLYRNEMPNPDVPLGGIPPYRIDIEGSNNRLTYHYRTNNPEVRLGSFDMTMEEAGFKKDGALHTNGFIIVSIASQPEEWAGLFDIKITIEW